MSIYFKSQTTTVYHGRFQEFVESWPDGLVISDPPYNIGFKYDIYQDNMPDDEYIEMLQKLKRFSKVVLVHYPEETARWIVPALGPAAHYGVWCYNSQLPRRFRLISYYGVVPEYSRITQPYKNLNDKRIKWRLENGENGTGLYEWWDDIQLVKNVSQEKGSHPCPIPEALAKRIIILCSSPGDVVIDPFAGSLTMLKAAQDLGYQSIGCEISENYIQEGIARMSQRPLFPSNTCVQPTPGERRG